MVIQELIAELGFDLKNEGDLRRFEQGLKSAESKLTAFAATATRIGAAIGVAAASALAALAKSSVSTAADFESLLTAIQKKAGATAEQMEAIGREILDLGMGGELASSIEEIAAAYERGAAAGLPLDELREFALLSTKAADAFEMSAEATGNAFVGFQKVLGVAGKDLERVADLINYLADSGIADERDIVAFMDSAGALAKTVGFSVEETAALAAALVNLKVPAGEAATAMNSVLTKLIAPQSMSKGARAAFSAVVGDVKAFAKAMSEDADKALVGLLEKLAQLDNSERAGAIAEIFGIHHADVVQQLVAGVDELKRNLAEAKNEAAWLGSLQNTYAMKLDDFWSRSRRFWNSVKSALITIGERALPMVGKWLDTVSDHIRTMVMDGSLEKWASRAVDTLARWGGAIGNNVSSVTGHVGQAVANLLRWVSGGEIDLSKWQGLAVALGALVVALAPTTAVIAGIIFALDDFFAYLTGGESYIGDFVDYVSENFPVVADVIRGTITAVEGLRDAYIGLLGGDVAGFVDKLSSAATDVAAAFEEARQAAMAVDWDEVGERIKDSIKGGVVGFGDLFTDLVPLATDAISSLDWTSAGEAIGGAIVGAIAIAIKARIGSSGISDALKDGIVEGLAGLDWWSIGSAWVDAIMAPFHAVRDLFIGVMKGIGSEVADIVVGWFDDIDLADTGARLGDRLLASFAIVSIRVAGLVRSWFEIDLFDLGANMGESLLAGLKSIGTQISQWFASLFPDWARKWVAGGGWKPAAFRAGEAAGALISGAPDADSQAAGESPFSIDWKKLLLGDTSRASADTRVDPGKSPQASGGGELRSMLQNMNANLAKMMPENAVQATVTDARQDNRQFPVTTSVTVNQTITQATTAPAAVARATGNAAASAANRASRFEMEPAF